MRLVHPPKVQLSYVETRHGMHHYSDDGDGTGLPSFFVSEDAFPEGPPPRLEVAHDGAFYSVTVPSRSTVVPVTGRYV